MKVQARAFTARAKCRANVIISPVAVSQAFHPFSKNPPTPVEFQAIWDTGASGTAITQKVVDKCKLKPIGMANVNTAGGQIRTNVYLINLFLPNKVAFHALRVTETRGEIAGGVDLLIGMDIIGSGDFAITCKDGNTTFSYRFPSCESIDFMEHKKSTKVDTVDISPPAVTGKVGRNDPCPCGSGKKYKKCCGG